MKNDNRKVEVNLTNKTIVRVILWLVGAIVAYKILLEIADVLTLIFGAFFLALALNPVVSWMSRRLRIKSRARATAAAYVTVISIIILFFVLITPPLVSQTRDFINEVPQQIDNFQKQDSGLAQTAKRYNLDERISSSAREFASNYGDFGSTVLDTGKRVAGIIISMLVVVVIAFMMLVEGPYWMELIWGLLPKKSRPRTKRLVREMYKGVSGFVNGQVIVSLVAGACVFVALTVASQILDVSVNATALAGIVAVFGIIPLFGNPISSTIVILFSLLSSFTLALVMLIYFVVYFFIENHSLQPYIQSRLNRLTALSVLVAALIGIGLAGFMGAIIAIPVASAIKVLVEDYFRRQSDTALPSTADIDIESI